MITKKELDATMAVVDRFAIAAVEAAGRLGEECRPEDWPLISGSKQTASLRRASMDLTRALAKLRSRQ